MRDIPVGNGSLLVNFDERYHLRDVYFPHVGQENQTDGYPSRFGVWASGRFSWVDSDEWSRELGYVGETLVTDVRLTNSTIGVEIVSNDTVASHENVFLRRIQVKNLFSEDREIRVFLHHDFRLYENKVGDTAYYDPETGAIIHYQKHRYFLINTDPHFNSFATGRKDFKGQEGTWRDAEDGELHGGAITEGSVDSTVGVHFRLGAGETFGFFCWLAAGTSHSDVATLDSLVRTRGPQKYLDYTSNYWRAWVNKNGTDLSELPEPIVDQYKRSLLIIRTQIDNDGAILAANDWDVTERATDHYSYLWTRDGALVANALDQAGYSHLTRKFFEFCARIVHPNGYFLQKYNADGTVASGWHASWDLNAKKEVVAIQEDETGLVLWSLWEHYQLFRDIEFAHRMYTKLVIPCADFMDKFVHPDLGLPKPSWNLWEDRRGIHTFTCATVVAGLRAAAAFARLFAEEDRAKRYIETAESMLNAMRFSLYSTELGRFYRSLQLHGDDHFEPDSTLDASLFALFYFGCFEADDPMVVSTMEAIEEGLRVNGGIARFSGDGYMRVSEAPSGNAWMICTLWLADYYITRARSKQDLQPAMEFVKWCCEHALPSGVMAEQIDPSNGRSLSVAPLTWSHSTFVSTIHRYLEKYRSLEI